nr:hypothetical protein [Acinetobacter baumannii]
MKLLNLDPLVKSVEKTCSRRKWKKSRNPHIECGAVSPNRR